MNFSQDVLLILLISIFTNATNTELFTNTNFLILLLLILSMNNYNTSTCPYSCSGN